jgi:CpeT protein
MKNSFYNSFLLFGLLVVWIQFAFTQTSFDNICPIANNEKAEVNKKDKELMKLIKFMSGSFNSREQALADTANFFEVHLNMKPIWKDKNIGYWLYVEQAMATALAKPYRQRVYHVFRKDDKIISEVYTLNNPLRFAGEHKKDNPLALLTPDSLINREGCAIILHKEGDVYVGQTEKGACGSDLRGATYATSEVRISKKKLESWDRGFNSDHKQVWGAVKSGYIFKKVKQY